MLKLQAVLACFLAVSASYTQAKQNDNKVDFNDSHLFVTPLLKLPSAIAASPEAIAEWKDANPEQRDELAKWVRSEFDIQDDKLEQKIEAAIQISINFGTLVA